VQRPIGGCESFEHLGLDGKVKSVECRGRPARG
jgi:hypothetical protein